jgi:hypothetical protein
VKSYVRYLWKSAVKLVYVHALLYLIFSILFTIHVVYNLTSLAFLIILFIFNIGFLANEAGEMYVMRLEYFTDLWNAIDFMKITFVAIYI